MPMGRALHMKIQLHAEGVQDTNKITYTDTPVHMHIRTFGTNCNGHTLNCQSVWFRRTY